MPVILSVVAILCLLAIGPARAGDVAIETFELSEGTHPHDVAPAPDGKVWYTAQHQGALGRLDPATGETEQVDLGDGSRPHGVIVGVDGRAWVTDSGLNAIVAVNPKLLTLAHYPLPAEAADANLNTATFDGHGVLWFTGQGGFYGSLNPVTEKLTVYPAPRGFGPYGIHHTPDGTVWFCSLAGNYIARIDSATGEAEVFDPPTAEAGTRRIWSDSKGRLWVSEWNAGQLARYDPADGTWREWPLPGDDPAAYAVYVDEDDMVWVSDFGTDAILRFDPGTETFESFPMSEPDADVRQMLGRAGEVWAAESGSDRLTVYRFD